MVAIALVATGLLVRRIPRQHRARVMIAMLLSASFLVNRTSRVEAASMPCSPTTTSAATSATAPTTSTTTTTVAPTTTTTLPSFTVTVLTDNANATVTNITGTGYQGQTSHAALSGPGTLTTGTTTGSTITITGDFSGVNLVTGGTCGTPTMVFLNMTPAGYKVDCTVTGNFSVTLQYAFG